ADEELRADSVRMRAAYGLARNVIHGEDPPRLEGQSVELGSDQAAPQVLRGGEPADGDTVNARGCRVRSERRRDRFADGLSRAAVDVGNDRRRVAAYDRVRGHVLRDDSSRFDDSATADGHARQDGDVRADRCEAADDDSLVFRSGPEHGSGTDAGSLFDAYSSEKLSARLDRDIVLERNP